MTTGLLLQAYVTLIWGGKNLSSYDDGAGGKQALAQNVRISLDQGEKAPSCSFEISPNPIGFKLFQEIKATALSKPWTVEIGYLNGSKVTWAFKFAGMNMTTGHDPKLEITGVSVLKGCWTDNKISYTMEEERPLSEIPKMLQEKAGDCSKELKVQFTGQALEEASKIMVKANQTQRTPHSILMDTLRPHGMDLQVGDTAFNGELVISYSPVLKGELEKDKPEIQDGIKPALPGKRKVFIIGPGLMENFTRKQSFNTGQSNTKRNSSSTSTQSNETEQTGVVQPNSPPQESAAEAQTTTATLGKSNPSSAESGVVKGSSLDQKARQAFSKSLTSDCNTTVFMTPYMVGIKPRDIIVVPSLKGPGDYLEDWEVTNVSYSQDEVGGVYIDLSGKRTFTGEEPMMDSATAEEVRGIVSQLTTPALWNKFYWIQGPTVDYPLAN